MTFWLLAPTPSMSHSVLFSTHSRTSCVMFSSSRPTFPNAMALKTLSPLISIRAAMVANRRESSWLRDMPGSVTACPLPHALLVQPEPESELLAAAAIGCGIHVATRLLVVPFGRRVQRGGGTRVAGVPLPPGLPLLP